MKSRFNQFYNTNFIGRSWRGGGGGGTSSEDDNSSQVHSESSRTTLDDGRSESDDDDSSDSDDEEGATAAASWDKNILTEGEFYVAMSMLVYIYALLRETSLLG